MKLTYEQASDVLKWACDTFLVEKKKVRVLMTQLKSNQYILAKMFTGSELLARSLQKRSNRLCKLGHSDMTLIIGCSIKYIDSDVILRNILVLARDIEEVLSAEVYKQALLRTDQHRIELKRKTLWLKILKIDTSFINAEF